MTPPVAAWVRDILPVLPGSVKSLYDRLSPGSDAPSDDINYQTNNTLLACSFAPATDPESGVRHSRMCWSSSPSTACDVWPWIDFGNISAAGPGVNLSTTSYNRTVVLQRPLPLLSRVYCVMAHENGAGDSVVVYSDGVQIGTSR